MRKGEHNVDAETRAELLELEARMTERQASESNRIIDAIKIGNKELKEEISEKYDYKLQTQKEHIERHDKYHAEHFEELKEIKEKTIPAAIEASRNDSRYNLTFIFSLISISAIIIGGIVWLIQAIP